MGRWLQFFGALAGIAALLLGLAPFVLPLIGTLVAWAAAAAIGITGALLYAAAEALGRLEAIERSGDRLVALAEEEARLRGRAAGGATALPPLRADRPKPTYGASWAEMDEAERLAEREQEGGERIRPGAAEQMGRRYPGGGWA